jgi:hypothetical protein
MTKNVFQRCTIVSTEQECSQIFFPKSGRVSMDSPHQQQLLLLAQVLESQQLAALKHHHQAHRQKIMLTDY